MTKEEFLQKLETMSKPYVESSEHQLQLRLALTSAKRSSRIGYLLTVLPCLFLVALLLKYLFDINLGLVSSLQQLLIGIESHPLYKWLIPLALLIGPMTGIVLNVLAITHFVWDKRLNEVRVSVRLKWPNLIAIAFCGLVVAVLALYFISSNIQYILDMNQQLKAF
jgi:hypothetical protein